MSKLEVKNLAVSYQTRRELVRALGGLSFSLLRGKTLGLWGHSGCGKSTIIKALLGLPISSPGWVTGNAWFEGERVSPVIDEFVRIEPDGTVQKDSVGFFREHQRLLKSHLAADWRAIFQEPIYSFEPGRPVGRQISGVLRHLAHADSASLEELADEFTQILTRLCLDPSYIRWRHNSQLSGGECQRILLALSLVGRPKLLLADEPTTAMDRDTRLVANELLTGKIRDSQMSLLIASHNRDELTNLVDNIIVLCRGVTVERFTRDHLLNRSWESFHPYTRKLWFARDVEYAPGTMAGRAESQIGGCPYAAECPQAASDPKLNRRCRNECPPFFEVNPGHEVSCWLFQEELETLPQMDVNTKLYED